MRSRKRNWWTIPKPSSKDSQPITCFSAEMPEPEKKKSSADTWKQNRKQKLKFTYKEQKEFETIDDDIAALEERLEQIDKEMAVNATNAGKLRELSEEQQETQQKLDEKMDRWVYLNDLAEQIEAQKE